MSDLANQMAAQALEAQKYSRKYLVLELDFSARSLSDIEDSIDTIDFALPGGASPDNIDQLVQLWGAYLGEVIRKQAGGDWATSDDGDTVLVVEGVERRPMNKFANGWQSGRLVRWLTILTR